MVTTRLTMIDAHEYICTVKDTFQDNREMYDTFLMVMKDFRTTSLAIAKVKDLFKGHRELILGFNKFMPEDYKITFESDEQHEKPPVKFVEAIDFVKKVKATLQNDHAFGSFLEIMQMFRQNKKSADEVYHEVCDGLFRDQPELRVEFTYFLPRPEMGWKYNLNKLG
ncbi:unnamed protein product [Thlaspi arvense]|uniref:Uncharacterized protein n=1 Tax=Thlaspi arvense TaxID=13288 RepID=A0AAU9RUC3_THLAR|nr:unnamed protein product [Thlaspi arvense]